jgi:hypothetical protein
MRRLLTGLLIAGLVAGPAASAPVHAAQGRFKVLLSLVEWEPDCDWAWPRLYPGMDPLVVRLGVQRWSECVDSQAVNDARVAAEAIETGQRRAIEDKRLELSRY